MVAGSLFHSLYLLSLVIDFHNKYKIKYINCKSTNKNSVCNEWYHTYHNSLENLYKLIDKLPKTFYSVVEKEKVSLINTNKFTYFYTAGYHSIEKLS